MEMKETKTKEALSKGEFEAVKEKTASDLVEIKNNEGPQYRRIRIPPHRYTPLKDNWKEITSYVVNYLNINIRFNPKSRKVELKSSENTSKKVKGPNQHNALQKAHDFIFAFALGFSLKDALALLRLDDLFIESFEVKDVKTLSGAHLSRAIGRICGQSGKTKNAIENATRTRIVVAGEKIHVLGSFEGIRIARGALCRLILGAPPGKVYGQMKNVAARMKERF
eukprot:snap_masked-scaffold_7-processed-gene-11.10-mRNA-1 protein AED:0.02 eAED:0.02 QI:0/-1/0/1/-1/1/1/0/223